MWVVMFGIIAVIFLVQLVITSTLASRGQELSDLDSQAALLARENQSIKEELAQKTSLLKISAKAQELGLIKPDSVVYVDVSSPVAILPQ